MVSNRTEKIMKLHAFSLCRVVVFLAFSPLAFGQLSQMTGAAAPALSGITLAELEQLALSSNPTLAQAAAAVRGARGRHQQAGLYPNPTVGYLGEQIRGGIQGGGEQGFFVGQNVVLGGKLGLARQVASLEQERAQAKAEEQRLRVLTSVRALYYRALAGQEMVELRRKLSQVAGDAVTTTRQLANVGQADKPDLLQAEVEADQAELAVEQVEQNQRTAWTELAAAVGRPAMPMTHLVGNLSDLPQGDPEQWFETIATGSPEVRIAQLGVSKAQAVLARSKKEAIPDLELRGGLQQNLETNDTTGRPLGLQGFAQVGIEIPVFNRNQGNVSAAQADVERSQQEVQRVQLSLRQRASRPFANYESARAAVERYRNRMIPHAQEAYDLYRGKYEQMAAAYPQVLIAQRTLFQLEADYVISLANLWANAVALQGFLLTDGLGSPAASGDTVPPVETLQP